MHERKPLAPGDSGERRTADRKILEALAEFDDKLATLTKLYIELRERFSDLSADQRRLAENRHLLAAIERQKQSAELARVLERLWQALKSISAKLAILTGIVGPALGAYAWFAGRWPFQ